MDTVKPLVSIVCLAYNHERFIERCIEGMVHQDVNFGVEIIIHDDSSTDRTPSIIEEYANKYPRLIKPILQAENKFSAGIDPFSTYAVPLCRGRYVALCEGDDFWIDNTKLQRHIDFLEKHHEFVMVYSDYRTVDEDGFEIRRSVWSEMRNFFRKKEGKIQKQLVRGNFIMTLTTVVRREALLEAEASIGSDPGYGLNIDFTLFLELSRMGMFHYDNAKTSAYRILSESMSHSADLDKRLRFIDVTIEIARHHNQKYGLPYNDAYFNRLKLSAELIEYARRNLYGKYFYEYFKGVKADVLNLVNFKNYLNLLAVFLKSVVNGSIN